MSQPIEFSVDGLTLRGKLFLADNPKKLAVLFLHGWMGMTNEPAAELLAENGYSSMTFSLSGHNDSEGKLENVTRAGSLKEVIAAYDFLKARLPENTNIAAAGSSYGSYMATLLSAERSLCAVSLRVPANYPDEQFDEPQLPQAPDRSDSFLRQWRKEIISHDATRSLKAVNNFGGEVQIIEAELDDLVPRETIQNYVNAVPDKAQLDYHFMKGWPHSLGDDPERNRQYQEMLLNWLNKINEQI